MPYPLRIRKLLLILAGALILKLFEMETDTVSDGRRSRIASSFNILELLVNLRINSVDFTLWLKIRFISSANLFFTVKVVSFGPMKI